ncbi:MAG TPA: gamma-glutamylcyclotransferase family protein [Terracidiphilus sp.]|jgi:gamma-glutamylcyclotransferase (GGCT)/AIG2-like uncharacterized protein YtfP|nr:gamma-glutamylcyclotransferase family protein [Terracidiphilus sp.]
MSSYLFAYGTLQPAYARPAIAHAIAKLRPIGQGSANGVLYDLGGYPGAVLDSSTDQTITGLVLQLPEDDNVLREIDAYEEFDPDARDSSQFIRVLTSVALVMGGTLQCWIYVYNRNPGSARILSDGVYRSRR